MKPNKKHLYQLLMRPPVNHGPQNEKNSVSRGREEEPSNLNLSEGPNRRLNANENAFEGKEILGINDISSSGNKFELQTT